jgi:mevalonate kinase
MEAIRKAAMDAGAVGMKFMGAGGGGCAIIFCRDKAAMAERLKGKARVLDFRFEV